MSRDECEHGSLRRSCVICERDENIRELAEQINEYAAVIMVADKLYTDALTKSDIQQTLREYRDARELIFL